jgi:hypothetical protein
MGLTPIMAPLEAQHGPNSGKACIPALTASDFTMELKDLLRLLFKKFPPGKKKTEIF